MSKFQPYNPKDPTIQQPAQIDVNDMLKIAMETDEGKAAYQSWIVQRDIVLSRIAKELPEGAKAYNEFETKIKDIYNNVLLKAVQNKKDVQQLELEEKLKKSEQSYSDLVDKMEKLQSQIDKLQKAGK